MGPLLTVTAAAVERDLVTLDDAKAALDITDSGGDTELERMISARSQAIYAWLGVSADQNGRRTLIRETMTAAFLADSEGRSSTLLLPWRIPLVSITSVVEAGVTLASTDYQIRPMMAALVRLDSAGEAPIRWGSGKIVVTYTAGWLDPTETASDIPPDLADAALQEIATAWRGRSRDPALRSEEIPDVYRYQVGYGQDGVRDKLMPETESALSAGGYKRWVIA